MCPCNLSFDHGATYDFCRATLAFHIREGEVEGTDISGLRIAVIIDTPKVMTDGNWRLGMFVDDQATDEQFDKLAKVFGGQLGGPMAALGPLVGEVVGVERAADRKSTRLNSSHANLSYAVLCLKKNTRQPHVSTPSSHFGHTLHVRHARAWSRSTARDKASPRGDPRQVGTKARLQYDQGRGSPQ